MEVRVDHLGDVQFEIKARGHKVYCDQPTEAGGFDEGMTPPEFFLASIGSEIVYSRGVEHLAAAVDEA